MGNTDKTIKVTKEQIRDVYKTLKRLSDSYSEKETSLSDAEWLASQYKNAFPSLSEREAAELGNATVNGVKRFNATLEEAAGAASEGKSREQWFSEKMSQELEGMDTAEAGKCVQALDSALFAGNQLMAEETPVRSEGDSIAVAVPDVEALSDSSDADSGQWNAFTVKEALLHLGQGASLVGLQTMNHTEGLDFAADAVGDIAESNGSLKAMIESGNTEQVKSLLTAALKIGADSDWLPIIPKTTPVDTIANVASHGVEYISALSQFSSGKITMLQAMDHVGLSGVSLLHNLCSAEGIGNISAALLSKIPVIGPILGNVVGGIISVTVGKKYHEKIQTAVKKVETKVRSAVNNAWNAVKRTGQKIKSKVKNAVSRLFS